MDKPVPKRRDVEERSEGNTGEAIVRAARRVFESSGYEGAKVESIIERAKISRGTVYSYFPNKKAVFLRVAEGLLEQMYEFSGKRFSGASAFERTVLSNACYLGI